MENEQQRKSATAEAQSRANEENKLLATDGPVSKAEGTESPDLNENDTVKSFDRDQEELDYGFKDGDLDTDISEEKDSDS
jgi:hypothetical protein